MIKQKIRKWLLGNELKEIKEALYLYQEIVRIAKEKKSYRKEELNLEEVVFLGDVDNCVVHIKPQVHNKVVLSEVQLEAAMRLTGDHQLVSSNVITVKKEEKK